LKSDCVGGTVVKIVSLMMIGMTLTVGPAAASGQSQAGSTTQSPPQVRALGPVGDEEHPARVASGVMAGQILHKEDPICPYDARQACVNGYVVMNAKIDPKGQVVDLKVVSGAPMLRDSAVAVVKKWTYKPYLLNGRAVFVLTGVTVAFTITP
jgi:TonB family protein